MIEKWKSLKFITKNRIIGMIKIVLILLACLLLVLNFASEPKLYTILLVLYFVIIIDEFFFLLYILKKDKYDPRYREYDVWGFNLGDVSLILYPGFFFGSMAWCRDQIVESVIMLNCIILLVDCIHILYFYKGKRDDEII